LDIVTEIAGFTDCRFLYLRALRRVSYGCAGGAAGGMGPASRGHGTHVGAMCGIWLPG
jgi:hypothetical protein